MLMWERLTATKKLENNQPAGSSKLSALTHRLPYDRRCAAVTASGRRCKGTIRPGTEFCPFHDPAVSLEQRRQFAAKGGRSHHKLSRLPDGYLRKLTDRRSIGDAMDRLYRELRLGLISVEMAGVLFRILTRLLDSGICDDGGVQRTRRRGRIERLRPQLSEILTRAERQAWRKAVENAPASFLRKQALSKTALSTRKTDASGKQEKISLPAAS